MALMNCPECNKQVSSTAATCPNCGAPIAQAHTRATIQKTSKRLKLQSALASTALVITISWFVIALMVVPADAESKAAIALPLFLSLLSGLWAILVKTKIWWHHE